MESYRDASKEQLLKLLAENPDIQQLHSKERGELLEIYCERIAVAAAAQAATSGLELRNRDGNQRSDRGKDDPANQS